VDWAESGSGSGSSGGEGRGGEGRGCARARVSESERELGRRRPRGEREGERGTKKKEREREGSHSRGRVCMSKPAYYSLAGQTCVDRARDRPEGVQRCCRLAARCSSEQRHEKARPQGLRRGLRRGASRRAVCCHDPRPFYQTRRLHRQDPWHAAVLHRMPLPDSKRCSLPPDAGGMRRCVLLPCILGCGGALAVVSAVVGRQCRPGTARYGAVDMATTGTYKSISQTIVMPTCSMSPPSQVLRVSQRGRRFVRHARFSAYVLGTSRRRLANHPDPGEGWSRPSAASSDNFRPIAGRQHSGS